MRSLRFAAGLALAVTRLNRCGRCGICIDDGTSPRLGPSRHVHVRWLVRRCHPSRDLWIRLGDRCLLAAGNVTVKHDLSIAPGALLDAVTPGDPTATPTVPATVDVGGNVWVGKGAALLLGCSPNATCGAAITDGSIGGSLIADGALGVVVHSTQIGGNVSIRGGGDGQSGQAACTASPAPWSEDPTLAASFLPPYTDVEDNVIGGSVNVSDQTSCWLGVLRNVIGGNLWISNNVMGDPDSNEVGNNLVHGNMGCWGNHGAGAADGDVARHPVRRRRRGRARVRSRVRPVRLRRHGAQPRGGGDRVQHAHRCRRQPALLGEPAITADVPWDAHVVVRRHAAELPGSGTVGRLDLRGPEQLHHRGERAHGLGHLRGRCARAVTWRGGPRDDVPRRHAELRRVRHLRVVLVRWTDRWGHAPRLRHDVAARAHLGLLPDHLVGDGAADLVEPGPGPRHVHRLGHVLGKR